MPDGLVALDEAVKKLKIDLVKLVAETAIWAPPEVHMQLQSESNNAAGAFFPKTRRCRPGELRRTIVGDEYMDDNTFANLAIKAAIGVRPRDIRNYVTCHIWPNTCYRSDCHTVIANLVLLPSPLADLTDHLPEVVASLKYHAFEKFKWYPPRQDAPERPVNYPKEWRGSMAFTAEIRPRIERRARNYLAHLPK